MRKVSEKESLEIITNCVGTDAEILNIRNHKKSSLRENTYQITINFMSLDILFSLMEIEEIKNVFFHPSAPPPGGHIDGIAQRYRLYVEYF